MRYFIYIFFCYLTKPFRFFYLSDFEFALCWLFPNTKVRQFVWSQISHETGKFTSVGWQHNNVCGMAYINGKYQDGWRLTPEGKKATYITIFKGLYDYYDLVKNRKKYLYESMEDKSIYMVGTTQVPDQTKAYIEHVVFDFKQAGFFTSSSVAYALAVRNHWNNFKSCFGRFILSLVLTLCVPFILLVWFSNIGRSRAYKEKIKQKLGIR